MPARHLPSDEPFFAEWRERTASSHRSLTRAAAIGHVLGALPQTVPVLTVVGSKGKGTAALHAAATLSAYLRPDGGFLRVGLVTSPSLRTNRERIRLDGRAIDEAALDDLAARLASARAAVPVAGEDYLSPTGAYTVAGVAWLTAVGADVIVLEEGLGGASDEVSLFTPDVVALSDVFAEHADLLGGTLPAVARDLLGVVAPGRTDLVTGGQHPAVEEAITACSPAFRRPPDEAGSAVPKTLAPLTRRNAVLGETAARTLAARHGWSFDEPAARAALATVRLPGRASRHVTPQGAHVMVDGAISLSGVRTAAEEYAHWTGASDRAVACFPDDKDVMACYAALSAFAEVSATRVGTHLRFAATQRLHANVLNVEDALRSAVAAGGCLAVGTQSFVGVVLDVLDVPTDDAYDAPKLSAPPPRARR